MAGIEKKNVTKSKIVNYIINHKATSKVELSKDLNISMPTVLSNVKELLAGGSAVKQSVQTAALIPLNLFAVMEIPIPVPQIRIPFSHSPSRIACATFFAYIG